MIGGEHPVHVNLRLSIDLDLIPLDLILLSTSIRPIKFHDKRIGSFRWVNAHYLEPVPYFFGAKVIALKKPDGGLRPIAVGNIFRLLPAKCAGYHVFESRQARYGSRQVCVGTTKIPEVSAKTWQRTFRQKNYAETSQAKNICRNVSYDMWGISGVCTLALTVAKASSHYDRFAISVPARSLLLFDLA